MHENKQSQGKTKIGGLYGLIKIPKTKNLTFSQLHPPFSQPCRPTHAMLGTCPRSPDPPPRPQTLRHAPITSHSTPRRPQTQANCTLGHPTWTLLPPWRPLAGRSTPPTALLRPSQHQHCTLRGQAWPDSAIHESPVGSLHPAAF